MIFGLWKKAFLDNTCARPGRANVNDYVAHLGFFVVLTLLECFSSAFLRYPPPSDFFTIKFTLDPWCDVQLSSVPRTTSLTGDIFGELR